MSNTSERDIVFNAYDLTVEVGSLNCKMRSESSRLNHLERESFGYPPSAPKRKIEPPITKPEIKYTKRFNWGFVIVRWIVIFGALAAFSMDDNLTLGILCILIASIGWIFHLVGSHKRHKAHIEAKIDEISKSAGYIERCNQLESERKSKQQQNDELYKKQMDVWNNITMPKYNEDKEKWDKEHLACIEKQRSVVYDVSKRLDDTKQMLNQLYADTKVIPMDYRNEGALSFIKQTLETTDYDVKTAIEMYDRKRQMALDNLKIREQQKQNALLDEQNALLDAQNANAEVQNELLYQQNEISERARRDANRAALVSAVQRHNTNKYLKGR